MANKKQKVKSFQAGQIYHFNDDGTEANMHLLNSIETMKTSTFINTAVRTSHQFPITHKYTEISSLVGPLPCRCGAGDQPGSVTGHINIHSLAPGRGHHQRPEDADRAHTFTGTKDPMKGVS